MNSKPNEMDDILQFCVCANLRKVARVVTQLYDNQLQPTGLKVTQYSMLANIDRHKDISISQLGEIMLLDQTTVTRNLNLLKKSGYVRITKSNHDSRAKKISLTDIGYAKLEEAKPIWYQIQEKVVHDIGTDKYKDLLETLKKLQ
ncbi:MarR family winged helix-turn-helix transcriptional regulator [Mesobacillus maritimus]|uniref:MarR family winged helix-turn-helix transcriptional regulator n=1 Tax=Mesobacillus maritimus TaxID=1643336 RepID=UPI00203DF6CE|nr:MarR family winged helix-turn-helix transcriptional regulator [Mesobacillus maritimus]MCM3588358.1 MarR family winged helix-turn-helix transcriptional regulator [Mesobacillus maritimus]MCM3671551.1 MarR family winged helix-turn-helix transcriptional regulator [Mesobacillus maritimus]